MRVNGDASSAIIVLFCVCFIAWFLWAIIRPGLQAIGRWLSGPQVQPNDEREAARKLLETPVPSSDVMFGDKPQPNDDREAARKLLETPVPSSDPKLWVRYKLEPEFVPAPQALIHVPSDAEHRASCARCQEEWKRSGRRAMPHATN